MAGLLKEFLYQFNDSSFLRLALVYFKAVVHLTKVIQQSREVHVLPDFSATNILIRLLNDFLIVVQVSPNILPLFITPVVSYKKEGSHFLSCLSLHIIFYVIRYRYWDWSFCRNLTSSLNPNHESLQYNITKLPMIKQNQR